MITAEVLTERVDAVNAYERNLRDCIRAMLDDIQVKKNCSNEEQIIAAKGAQIALLVLAEKMGIEL